MKQYLDLLRLVQEEGFHRDDRTGVGTKGVFGAQARFDLRHGFPLLTTKKLHIKSILHELLWFIAGDTNVKYLRDNGVTIWDEWADENGDLGRVYGAQWRSWNYVDGHGNFRVLDQITDVIQRIKDRPDDRRLIVTAWNPGELGQMALPPCHCLFQFSTQLLTFQERWDMLMAKDVNFGFLRPKEAIDQALIDNRIPERRLHLQLYQRSCDLFLGVPFNVASYAFLLEMVAHVTGMQAGTFIHTYGDLHVYNNHWDQVAEQLSRTPGRLPRLKIKRQVDSIFDFKFDDFEIVDYVAAPSIKAPIAV